MWGLARQPGACNAGGHAEAGEAEERGWPAWIMRMLPSGSCWAWAAMRECLQQPQGPQHQLLNQQWQ